MICFGLLFLSFLSRLSQPSSQVSLFPVKHLVSYRVEEERIRNNIPWLLSLDQLLSSADLGLPLMSRVQTAYNRQTLSIILLVETLYDNQPHRSQYPRISSSVAFLAAGPVPSNHYQLV